MGNNNAALHESETFMDVLKLMRHLQTNRVAKRAVLEKVKENLKDHFRDMDMFIGNDERNGFLPKAISESNTLRKMMLKDADSVSSDSSFFTKNADTCYDFLVDNIFAFFAYVYYMYYECSMDCELMLGGRWCDQCCDTTDHAFSKWLTDRAGKALPEMLPRGMDAKQLSDKHGDELFDDHETDILILANTGGDLQHALYYMLLLPSKWRRSMTAHSLLFLRAFCEILLKNRYYNCYPRIGETLKKECEHLNHEISIMTQYYVIVPVCSHAGLYYSSLPEAHHYHVYLRWLKENMEHIIASVRAMTADFWNWNAEAMESCSAYGPYPWGFTFHTGWDHRILITLRRELGELSIHLGHFKGYIEHLPCEMPKNWHHRCANFDNIMRLYIVTALNSSILFSLVLHHFVALC